MNKCPYCGCSNTTKVVLKFFESPGFMEEIPYTHRDENGRWYRFEEAFLCEKHMESFKDNIQEYHVAENTVKHHCKTSKDKRCEYFLVGALNVKEVRNFSEDIKAQDE
jgi:hypothetical protein